MIYTTAAIVLLSLCSPTFGFAPSATTRTSSSSSYVVLRATAKKDPVEDDIAQLQRKARQLLEKSKAKLASKEDKQKAKTKTAATSALPFFATVVISREGVIKSRNEETGLLVADGERMAALSEKEEWQVRPLFEVFENEMSENEDVYSLASQQLAQRDVAASIFDLRKQLQTDDYKKIFNKRNPFIGEDN